MNASDVIGWIVDGTYYCNACTPSREEGDPLEEPRAHPVFADSETDSFSHCATCEELIPEQLTTDGYDDAEATFERFLVRRDGRGEIVRQWAEHLRGAVTGAYLDTLCRLILEATEDENVKATKLNVARKVRDILLGAEPCEDCTNPECMTIRAAIKEIES